MVLERRGVLAGDSDPAPHMLRRPVVASPPLLSLADGDAIGQLRAALASLAARDDAAALPGRLRAWLGRATGRTNRYVLDALVRATDEIAERCDEIADRLAAQEAVAADVTRAFGEELTLLRAEVVHLRRLLESSPRSTESPS